MSEIHVLRPPLGAPDCYSSPNVPKVRSAAWFAQLEERKRQSDFEQGHHFPYREDTLSRIGHLAGILSTEELALGA